MLSVMKAVGGRVCQLQEPYQIPVSVDLVIGALQRAVGHIAVSIHQEELFARPWRSLRLCEKLAPNSQGRRATWESQDITIRCLARCGTFAGTT